MAKTFEVVFEDKVLKPLSPVDGMQEHERAWVLVRSLPKKESLRKLYGTLSKSDAQDMRKIIDGEFEKIEGQW